MNVFWHDLRMQRKSLIVWLVIMAFFIFVSLIKFDTITATGDGITEIFKNMPATLQAIFGMSGLDPSKLGDYIGICFIFIAVMSAIFAGMLGAGVISIEETDKTAEFIYPKPIARSCVLAQKIMVASVGIALMTATIYLSLVVATVKYSPDGPTLAIIANLTTAAFLVMILSASLGMLFSSSLKQSKRAVGAVSIFVVVSYFAYTISKISTDSDWLRYVSIFRWFDAVNIIHASQLEAWTIASAVTLTVACISVSFVAFRMRDFET